MKEGIVPPTINLDNPDLEAGCDLDYVPNVAHHYKEGEIPTAILSDNLGFGEPCCFHGAFFLVSFSLISS
jgi:3-oxoacyl-[acyl-carrier-protein] synthase II